MATYIALLRGVNVGNNTLKMERLRELWRELGFESVETYLQSGNVVFEAKAQGAAAWQSKARAKLAGETRLPVSILFRSARELEKMLAGNPFLEDKKIDVTKLHVTFCEKNLPKDAAKRLAGLRDLSPLSARLRKHEALEHAAGKAAGRDGHDAKLEDRRRARRDQRARILIRILLELETTHTVMELHFAAGWPQPA